MNIRTTWWRKRNKNYQEVDQLKLTVKFIIGQNSKTILNPDASEERLLLKCQQIVLPILQLPLYSLLLYLRIVAFFVFC
jgi:hypothetical protein